MKWRLGLDVGTDSLGWAALRLHEGSEPELLDMGARIFANGRENAADNRVGAPLNEARRLARQMRKQRDRRIRRKQAMARYLTSMGYLPHDKSGRMQVFLLDPYKLRADALERVLDDTEISRVLMHFTTRRGFKSNRKSDMAGSSAVDEEKAMLAGVEKLKSVLDEKTLGQWLHERRIAGIPIRFRPIMMKSKITYQLYPSREMYENEFSRIRTRQEPHHSGLDWDRLHLLIFFQRPLKRPERGFCQFYETEPRAYKASPSAQRFRIIQDLQNLRYYDENNVLVLVPVEIRMRVFELLLHQKSLSFGKIREMFGEEFDAKFNLEDEKRKDLRGSEIACDMRKPGMLGSRWDDLTWNQQDDLVEFLVMEEDFSAVKDALEPYGIGEEDAKRLFSYNYPTGTTMLSAKFMREASTIMLEHDVMYHEAAVIMGLHHSVKAKRPIRRSLPYYGEVLKSSVIGGKGSVEGASVEIRYGRIPNPTVHIALNQIRKVINALLRRFGNPAEIIVEVGRDLKINDAKKVEIFKRQAKNQAENQRMSGILSGTFGVVNPREYLKKFRLWEELGVDELARHCPYCGRAISARQMISAEAEIEHILPYSLTLLDSMDNLTLAHRECNRIKGERSPHEAFGSNPEGFDWARISENARKFPYRKRIKFAPDALKKYLEEGPGFIASQLTDNAYIAKATKDYLSVICDRDTIWVTTGQLTALLRAKWGLNTILSASHDVWKKNRTDHRHHAVDALVIGLCDRGLINEAARINANHGFGKIVVPECPVARGIVEQRVAKILVSRKEDHGWQGKLFMETALGERTFFKRVKPDDLRKDDIQRIVPPRIREFVVAAAEKGSSFFSVKKMLADRYEYFVLVDKRFVTRAPLESLSFRDIEDICDPAIRSNVRSAVNGITDKKELAKTLAEYAKNNRVFSVRYFPKNTTAIKIGSVPNKAYMPADFYRVDIWAIPEKGKKVSYNGVFIPRIEAAAGGADNSSSVRKPHPAAKFVCSLYKGDVIEVEHEGAKVYCRVAGYSTTQNKVDLQPLSAGSDITSWRAATPQKLISPFWPIQQDGQNYKGINPLFQTSAVNAVKISSDGRLVRR